MLKFLLEKIHKIIVELQRISNKKIPNFISNIRQMDVLIA